MDQQLKDQFLTSATGDVRCLACQGGSVIQKAKLPGWDAVGHGLEDVPSGHLYRCRDCQLQFRWPIISAAQLVGFYKALGEEVLWKSDEPRVIWSSIADQIQAVPKKSVLDVGCFRGDLLDWLGNSWERFAVEPSTAARQVAESRGIRVIADCVESLDRNDMKFGAVTLIDVIEHLSRPIEAIQTLSQLMEKRGRLVIFTGTTDAVSWRLSAEHYWYSAMPEHVAFFCPEWFHWAARQTGLKVKSISRHAYCPAKSWKEGAGEAIKNLCYVAHKRAKSGGVLAKTLRAIPYVGRAANWNDCWWTTARDHLLVTLEK